MECFYCGSVIKNVKPEIGQKKSQFVRALGHTFTELLNWTVLEERSKDPDVLYLLRKAACRISLSEPCPQDITSVGYFPACVSNWPEFIIHSLL